MNGFALAMLGIETGVGGVLACGGVFCVGDDVGSVVALVTGGDADPFDSELVWYLQLG